MSQFYQQIVQIKTWINEGQLNTEVATFLALNAIPKPLDMANAVSLKLQQWIHKHRQLYQQQLTEREKYLLDKACFAMAALADELFILELDWPGQEHWEEVLLEQEFYQSCNAGVRFFDHLNELINGRSHGVVEQQLATLYLLVLRLGFSGQYRNSQSS